MKITLEEVKVDNEKDYDLFKNWVVEYTRNYEKEHAKKFGIDDPISANYTSKDYEKYNNNFDLKRFFIIKEEIRIGLVEYRYKESCLGNHETILYINNLYVKEEYRKQGIAKSVIDFLKLQSYPIELTCWYSKEAQAFYEKLNLSRISTIYRINK